MVEENKEDYSAVTQTWIGDLIGSGFLAKRGITDREKEETTATEDVTLEVLKEPKFLGIFFSAGWCAPCKLMLKPLKDFYTDINMQSRQMEVLYVPVDRDADSWKQHYASMPWLSLAQGDQRVAKLMAHFKISGIPALVVVEAETGFKVTDRARKDISSDANIPDVIKSWTKQLTLNKEKKIKHTMMAEASKLEQEKIAAEKKQREADAARAYEAKKI